MISFPEIARPVAGAWLILGNRRRAMSYFDTSVRGFWLSFAVLVLVSVPTSYLMTSALAWSDGRQIIGADRIGALWSAIADVVGWLALPVLLAITAKSLGLADRVVGFIVARNWSGLIVMLFLLAFLAAEVLIAGAASLLRLDRDVLLTIGGAIGFALLVLVIRYAYLVVRIGLQLGFVASLAVVALDLILQLGISTGLTVLFGFGRPAI